MNNTNYKGNYYQQNNKNCPGRADPIVTDTGQ